MNILLIEDETRIADFIRKGLAAEGWSVDHASDGESGLEHAQATPYDVIVLDLMLPGIQGQDVCRLLRARKNVTPILMLTALDTQGEKVEGLRLGADDYLTKPFDFDELVARIEALYRRSNGYAINGAEPQLCVGDITYDKTSMQVTMGGEDIEFTKKELDLLVFFMSNTGRVLSRERILNSVWGMNEDPLTNVVDVYVGRIRRKLSHEGARIVTLRHVGYRMSQ